MIEVIYARYNCLYSEEFDSIEEALQYIERGSDDGYLYPIGIYENSKPIIKNGYVSSDAPNKSQEEEMIIIYQEVRNYTGPGAPSVK